MRLASLLAIGALTACTPSPGADVSMNRSKLMASSDVQRPAAMARFGQMAGARPQRSNDEIARDFMELSFRMESGRTLPVLTRFEAPITVRIVGRAPANASTDLARLLHRFRNEAGIDIREIAGGSAAINIEFVPRKTIQTTYSNVACFVVPNVASWSEFKRARRSPAVDWTRQTTREKVGIFVPSDSSAQEVRDCLHEELAQAMGPLNDLFRLTDSVFNDDNFHTSLTGFDMAILRAYYAPELRSGMTEAEVAQRLPAILARVNPAGQFAGSAEPSPTPRHWANLIATALGNQGDKTPRKAAARQALGMARSYGWTDGRLAFSYFALGRLTLSKEPDTAVAAFAEASRIYRGLPGGEIHAAHVDMQMAAYALSRGDAARAIEIANRTMPVVAAAENAALMATLMLVKAEALSLLGRDGEARAVRIDSQGWARYGFGSDAQMQARAAEIAALAQRGNKS